MSRKTILFVDDEVMITKWFERTFSPDFHVVCANSVDDALLILRSKSYDVAVLVTDFRMPERDGLVLLKVVAEEYPAIVKILASAYADKDLVIQAVNQQLVFRVLEKPCDDLVVEKTLRDALRQHESYTQERRQLTHSMAGMRESLGFLGHELSSPLAMIGTYLEMLQGKPITAAATQATQATLESALMRIEFCLSLVRSFTESSRLALTKTPPQALSAARLVQLVVSELPMTTLQRQSISMKLLPDFFISSKHNLVYLCISSIVNNALRERAEHIHIDMGVEPKPWIRISDNAAGIAPDILAELLKKPLTTYADEGSKGMGLIFCQKVMVALAGNLTIESRHASQGHAKDQTGTSVFLHFPAYESAQPDES